MKSFLYIVYISFIVAAARRFWSLVGNYAELHVMRTRDEGHGSIYDVKLGYMYRVPVSGGYMNVFLDSQFCRKFRCRGACGYIDAIPRIRAAMERYIRKHGGLGVNFDYSLTPVNYRVTRLNTFSGALGTATGPEFDFMREAFYGIPRDL